MMLMSENVEPDAVTIDNGSSQKLWTGGLGWPNDEDVESSLETKVSTSPSCKESKIGMMITLEHILHRRRTLLHAPVP